MTFKELQKHIGPLAERLEEMARFAEGDEFAPWVVEALYRSAALARLEDRELAIIQNELTAERLRG